MVARRKADVPAPFRRWVLEELKPILPKDWRLVPYAADVDAPSVPTVLIKLQSVAPLPGAPLGHLNATYVVTIVEPQTDAGTADRNLDDELLTLLHALDGVQNLIFSQAERVAFDDVHMAYDVSLTVITSKD
jgi:hypothetical protein